MSPALLRLRFGLSLRIAIPDATTHWMAPVCPRKGGKISEPKVVSQIQTVLSSDLDNMRLQSGEYTTEVTEPSWPINIARAS